VNAYEVRPADAGWELSKRQGRVLGIYDREDSAIQAARIVARGNPPSEVLLHEPDGTRRIVATNPEDPRPARETTPGNDVT
jgi:hypothetical protein